VDWQVFDSWGFNAAFFVGLPLAIAGLYLGLKAIPRSNLSYFVQNMTVINETWSLISKEMKVTYDGLEVPRLTLSNAYIWNDGNQTIRRADITPKKPLAFRLPAGQHLLQYAVVSSSEDAMDAEIRIDDDGAAQLTFEYIDPGQGIKCVFLHSGSERDLSLSGVLMGASLPTYKRLPSDEFSTSLFTAVMIAGLSFPLGIMQLTTTVTKDSLSTGWSAALLFGGLVGSLAWMFMVVQGARRYSASKINFGKNASRGFQVPAQDVIIIPTSEY
jgi:hypothetical protein